MKLDLAERIGQWALHFEPSAAHAARIRASVRDFMGCVVAGTRRSELRPALWLAHGGAVPVWGLSDSFDPAGAALITGTAGSLLQLHDVFVPAGMHPSSTVIPAAWAALHGPGARQRTAFVRAVAAGYETANRFAMACAPGQALAGSSATATAGAIGAAVAAALIAGVDAPGVAAAVANAALLLPAAPSASMRAHGALAPLHSGVAARAGYEAASLGRAGSAGREVLEGNAGGPGLIQLLRGSPLQLQPESWNGATLDAVCWKFFPACFASLAAVEAALQLPLADRQAIESVRLQLPDRMLALVGHGPHSDELYDRLMSLRWSVACALLHGQFNIDNALDANDATLALAQRVEITHSAALDALLPQTIAADIHVQAGRHSAQLAYRRSATTDPAANTPRGWTFALDEPALQRKFNALTRDEPALADSLGALLAA